VANPDITKNGAISSLAVIASASPDKVWGAALFRLLLPMFPPPNSSEPTRDDSPPDQESNNRIDCHSPGVCFQSEISEHNATKQEERTKNPGSHSLNDGSFRVPSQKIRVHAAAIPDGVRKNGILLLRIYLIDLRVAICSHSLSSPSAGADDQFGESLWESSQRGATPGSYRSPLTRVNADRAPILISGRVNLRPVSANIYRPIKTKAPQ
jgi:hypothetical protein